MPQVSTLRELAARLKLGKSTVAYALRDDARIAAETRARVQREAARLGYRPNALASDFLRSVRMGKAKVARAALAYLTDLPPGQGLHAAWHPHRATHDAAQARATELGYSLDHFYLEAEDLRGDRLTAMLEARGIRGVILGPVQRRALGEYRLDFSRFVFVTGGYSVRAPHLHRVCHNTQFAVEEVFERARTAGLQRIGTVVRASFNRRLRNIPLSAYLGLQRTLPARCRLEPLVLEEDDAFDRRCRLWLRRQKPDLVLCWHNETPEWLGLPPPAPGLALDTATVMMNWEPEHAGLWAGIDQRFDVAGRMMIDFLADQLRAGRIGLPEMAIHLLNEGIWRPGASFPEVKAKKSAACSTA